MVILIFKFIINYTTLTKLDYIKLDYTKLSYKKVNTKYSFILGDNLFSFVLNRVQ